MNPITFYYSKFVHNNESQENIEKDNLSVINEQFKEITLQKTAVLSSPLSINHYTFEKAEQKFERNLNLFRQDLATTDFYLSEQLDILRNNQDFKDKAKKLTHLVKQNFSEQVQLIQDRLTCKKQRKPTQEELDAKIYNLSLNTQLEIFIHKNGLLLWDNLPKTWKISRPNQQAPHTKLLGQFSNYLYRIKTSDFSISYIGKQTHHVHLIYIKQLGEGSYNRAYSVYHLERGKQFISRELRHCQQNERGLKTWTKEAFIHKQLMEQKVPGIVKLYDIYNVNIRDACKRALLLEKCEGDLYNFSKKPDLATQYSMMEQILTSLIILHEKGYIHQDITPSNIFFKYKKDQIKTKIGDFGLANQIGDFLPNKGTFFYQPIEAFFITPYVSCVNDIWAAGLIAYHLRYCINSSNRLYGPYLNKNHGQVIERMVQLHHEVHDFWIQYQKSDLNFAIKWINHHYPSIHDSPVISCWIHNKQAITIEEFHNQIIAYHFYHYFAVNFNSLRKCLKKDPYDRMISGLLNPDPTQRISLQQALYLLQNK